MERELDILKQKYDQLKIDYERAQLESKKFIEGDSTNNALFLKAQQN